MFHHPITADTASARPLVRYTRPECAAIVGSTSINHPLFKATPEQLTDALFQIAGERPVHGAAVGECDNCWGLIVDGRCGSCGEAA